MKGKESVQEVMKGKESAQGVMRGKEDALPVKTGSALQAEIEEDILRAERKTGNEEDLQGRLEKNLNSH